MLYPVVVVLIYLISDSVCTWCYVSGGNVNQGVNVTCAIARLSLMRLPLDWALRPSTTPALAPLLWSTLHPHGWPATSLQPLAQAQALELALALAAAVEQVCITSQHAMLLSVTCRVTCVDISQICSSEHNSSVCSSGAAYMTLCSSAGFLCCVLANVVFKHTTLTIPLAAYILQT